MPGFFDKLFRRSPPPPAPAPPAEVVAVQRPATAFDALADQHLGVAFERQILLSELIGSGTRWTLDPATWTLTLAAESFEAELLGAIRQDGVWTWAWHELPAEVPPRVVREAQALRALGEAQALPELTTPSLGGDDKLLHVVGAIASGLHGGAYYRAPSPAGGAMLLYLADPRLADLGPPGFARAQRVLMNVIGSGAARDIRAMARAYLSARGFSLHETEAALRGSHDEAGTVEVGFAGGGVTVRAWF